MALYATRNTPANDIWADGHSYGSAAAKKGPLNPSFAPSPPLTTKKLVSFKGSVNVRKTIHINDYSNAEVQASWFDSLEFRSMLKDTWQGAELIESGLLLEDKNDIVSRRGLEGYTRSGSERRMKMKSIALGMVMEEQQLQRAEGTHHPEYIAEVYEEVSSMAISRARATALKDQLDAMV